MNEKIKQLANQARKHYPATDTSGEFETFNEELFAELIVKECLGIVASREIFKDVTEWEQGYNKAGHVIYHDISTMFGVEL